MSDLVEWPPLDIFWQVVEDLLSEMYMKSQPSLDEYEPATKRFLAYLFFIVCGLNQDQINVIFYAAIPYCYNTAKKADKIRASKSWEFTHMWIENQLISKIMEDLKL